jgi:intracellular septation protein A
MSPSMATLLGVQGVASSGGCLGLRPAPNVDGSMLLVASLVYEIVQWWPWSMCNHQRWIMLVVGVLLLAVGWVLGESLFLAIGLTLPPMGIVLLGGVCR